MLVLERRENEEILVRDAAGEVIVRVVAVEINGGRVKLGFEASHEYAVTRRELPYVHAIAERRRARAAGIR